MFVCWKCKKKFGTRGSLLDHDFFCRYEPEEEQVKIKTPREIIPSTILQKPYAPHAGRKWGLISNQSALVNLPKPLTESPTTPDPARKSNVHDVCKPHCPKCNCGWFTYRKYLKPRYKCRKCGAGYEFKNGVSTLVSERCFTVREILEGMKV